MDNLCQYINRTINIDTEREMYTKMYDTVRTAVINGLKKNNEFKLLFSDLRLCGSYADNLKVSRPDEFDLVMCLKFPHNERVRISPDNINRGSVFINISGALECLEKEKNAEALQFLKGMVNAHAYFLEDKFQNWLQGCFSRLLQGLNNELAHTDGSILRLRYRKQGPAHTIDVTNSPHEFAIDFVPGFLFEASKKICNRQVTSQYWQAIPKPMGVKENKSFRTSYTDSERKLFEDKKQFKAILRMMKKFRDNKPKMVNLKSYYIKTIFLWHDEHCAPNFWCKPSIELVQEMFAVLETALSTRMIPFFWDKNLNLLGCMSPAQITSMYYEVAAARRILMQPRGKFVSIFLTGKEQEEYSEYQGSEEVTMDELCQKISSVISTNCQKDSRVSLQIEFVRNKFINQLKKNEDFCLLFHGIQLCGRYTDNWNVSKLKRANIVICLVLPHNEDVTISRDNVNTGNVFINISTVLDRLERNKRDDACKFLRRMVNVKKYLLQDTFQNWFESCVDAALRKLNRQLVYNDGSTLHLNYRKHGPAHRIEITNFLDRFAIDFVPGFLIEASKKICKREVTSEYWQAIPEPRGVRDNMSFRPSYVESERSVFVNQNQFKNALRIMKKFRDNKPTMVNLKTYHIMTLFLWRNEECASKCWSKPTIEILHEMFKKLRDALDKGQIPSFWEKKLNLLSGLSANQIQSMYAEVRRSLFVLMHPASRKEFLAIFLNCEEISKVTTVTNTVERLSEEEEEEEEEEETTLNTRRQELSSEEDNTFNKVVNALFIAGLATGAAITLYRAFMANSRREPRNQ